MKKTTLIDAFEEGGGICFFTGVLIDSLVRTWPVHSWWYGSALFAAYILLVWKYRKINKEQNSAN